VSYLIFAAGLFCGVILTGMVLAALIFWIPPDREV